MEARISAPRRRCSDRSWLRGSFPTHNNVSLLNNVGFLPRGPAGRLRARLPGRQYQLARLCRAVCRRAFSRRTDPLGVRLAYGQETHIPGLRPLCAAKFGGPCTPVRGRGVSRHRPGRARCKHYRLCRSHAPRAHRHHRCEQRIAQPAPEPGALPGEDSRRAASAFSQAEEASRHQAYQGICEASPRREG